MRRQTTAGRVLHDLHNRGPLAWVIFALLSVFYVFLYSGFYSSSWTPLDQVLFGRPLLDEWGRAIFDLLLPSAMVEAMEPGRWSLYGLGYTLAISAGGAWMIRKYRHNAYQIVRTSVVIVVQATFAFSIPHLLKFFHQPDYYFSYIWPLKIDYLDPSYINYVSGSYSPAWPYVVYSFLAAIVLVPVMALLFGKRWYCSWICGCGGLANTFGEPWRHLSNKSTAAWKFEKVSIHAVLVLASAGTGLWLMSVLLPETWQLGRAGDIFRRGYGIAVTASLSGIAGVSLYPLLGTRVWCRFFCPMAALLGLLQKFGRFRIRVKRHMCISCGMCSKYCEMGIDVRSYAQANRSFTRASCVGCGLCSEVCPRGVLRLENQRPWDPQELTMRGHAVEGWKGHESTIDGVR